ncbi:MAG: hypothetical protein AAFO69_04645 [Bacteroidota bacterium]
MKNIVVLLLTIAAVLTVSTVTAQIPNPPATPIDGGLGLLLAGGAIYGYKKLRDSQKEK